jgi:hypothetical protein
MSGFASIRRPIHQEQSNPVRGSQAAGAPACWSVACKAAEQSPTALRRFVETMNVIRISIWASDYVDAKTAQNWERRQVTDQKSGTTDSKVASSERR